MGINLQLKNLIGNYLPKNACLNTKNIFIFFKYY